MQVRLIFIILIVLSSTAFSQEIPLKNFDQIVFNDTLKMCEATTGGRLEAFQEFSQYIKKGMGDIIRPIKEWGQPTRETKLVIKSPGYWLALQQCLGPYAPYSQLYTQALVDFEIIGRFAAPWALFVFPEAVASGLRLLSMAATPAVAPAFRFFATIPYLAKVFRWSAITAVGTAAVGITAIALKDLYMLYQDHLISKKPQTLYTQKEEEFKVHKNEDDELFRRSIRAINKRLQASDLDPQERETFLKQRQGYEDLLKD